jgi:Winged helix-turn-helix DNA-binding
VDAPENHLPAWRLVSNHGLLLLAVANKPDARVRELAAVVGVSERACQSMVNDLCSEGYLSRRRVGRRNLYRVHVGMPMRHPALRGHEVAELLGLLGPAFTPDWAALPLSPSAR